MRKVFKVTLLWISFLCAGVAVWGPDALAQERIEPDTTARLKEMPLLKGELWQKMTQDEKVAFIWGMGHVVTIERESMRMHPELNRDSFAANLSKGIAGMPMNRIINVVDSYYKENPASKDEPVLKVIWDKLVRPKTKAAPPNLPVK